MFVIGSTSMVFAGFDDSNMEEGLKASPVFTRSGMGSWGHEKGTPRFGDGGRIAIGPSQPGENSAAVDVWKDGSIVSPNP